MRDGEVIQAGTPERIILPPSTGYVRAFTRNAARAKVLRAATLMKTARRKPPGRLRVPFDARIEAVAPRQIGGNADAAVADAQGKVIGMLERRAAIDALRNRTDRLH